MSLVNKLFSLLGFSDPVELLRFKNNNLLPSSLLYLTINGKEDENDGSPLIDSSQEFLAQMLQELSIKPLLPAKVTDEDKVSAMIIDARNYISEQSYQSLYQVVHQNIKKLNLNARIVVLATAETDCQSHQQKAFSRALLGFTKSLAKEVGRKGTTANILYLDQQPNNINSLSSPLSFCLSSKSSFVSGQALVLNNLGLQQNDDDHQTHDNKIALVTGAAQGIGLSISQTLARDGFKVIGVDIAQAKDQLENEMQAINGLALSLDISLGNAGEQLVSFLAKNQLSGLDVIVHNAGITRDKTLAKMPEHWWQNTININLLSVMRINEYLLAQKAINANGRIVCMSSMNGIAGQVGQTNYATSKAGLIGYVESFSQEIKPKGITINAIAPGFIETKMTDQIPFVTREMGRRMNALSQGGKAIDVAEAVAFFAQGSTSAITGQTLRVCGLNFIGA